MVNYSIIEKVLSGLIKIEEGKMELNVFESTCVYMYVHMQTHMCVCVYLHLCMQSL